MGRAKEIIIKVIPSSIANPFIRKHHYSGKVVANSQLHFGVFLDNELHGVLSYGPSTDKSKLIGLVEGTGWNDFIELNRMAFDEYLPKYSESRAISQTIKLIKKHAPHIMWILSFADGTSCGDGTIYRASNFILTGIKKNTQLLELPNGDVIHKLTLTTSQNTPIPAIGGKTFLDVSPAGSVAEFKKLTKAKPKEGYQFRYIYFIDKKCRAKLTVPEIPFSRIKELGIGMYKGQRIEGEQTYGTT